MSVFTPPFLGALFCALLLLARLSFAETFLAPVVPSSALADSSALTLPPASPSLRPAHLGLAPIVENATPSLASTDQIGDSTRSMEDFVGPNEGPVFRTAVDVNLLQPWSTR